MNKIFCHIIYVFSYLKYVILNRELSQLISDKTECIVLWNWPSLKEIINNKHFFLNKNKIAVNNFASSDIFQKIKPEYYIIADSWFWDQNRDNANIIKNEINVNNKYVLDIRRSFLDSLITKVEWPMILFLPLQAKWKNNFNEILWKNKFIVISYYNMTPVNFWMSTFRNCLYKYNFWMPTSQTVTIAAIFIALNLKFKKIYLVWWDHSWHEDLFVGEDNVLYTKDSHFYENNVKYIPIVSDGTRLSKIHEEFFSLYKAFKWHIFLEEYSRYLGAKIYNASAKSYIDAYERIKI